MYAPLDPSVLKLQLQISDVDSSALQLVPLQHRYIYIYIYISALPVLVFTSGRDRRGDISPVSYNPVGFEMRKGFR